MMKPLVLLAGCLMALSLAGCNTALTPLPTSAALTTDDNGKVVTVAVGGTITATLASNPTTGYAWTLPTLQDTRVVRFVSSNYQAPSSPAVGAGGTTTFVFQVAGQGIAPVRLVYARPFAPQDNPSFFTFTVVAKPQVKPAP
jgi:inhibitor of cysteine peptidase